MSESSAESAPSPPSRPRPSPRHTSRQPTVTGQLEQSIARLNRILEARTDAAEEDPQHINEAPPPKRKRGRPKNRRSEAIDGQNSKPKRVRPLNSKSSNRSELRDVITSTEAEMSSESPVLPSPSAPRSGTEVPEHETSELPSNQALARPQAVAQDKTSLRTTGVRTPRTPTIRPSSLSSVSLNTLVAFSPVKEGFLSEKNRYTGVGEAFLVGRVCRIVSQSLFHVQWLDSRFQGHVEQLSLTAIQRGQSNYCMLHGSSTESEWSRLCAIDDGEDVHIDDDVDSLEQYTGPFDPPVELPTTLAEVEAIKNMRFEPDGERVAPTDLYQHADGTTKTKLRTQFKHLFEHSASSSFFAYIPVSFWQQVVNETNNYAQLLGVALPKPFSLDEIMTFLGILFYMSLVDKGHYTNYWGEQVEDTIFGGTSSTGLDRIMPLERFKQLRTAFTFHCVEANSPNQDQAARIRPLLNLLKTTGSKYVKAGRNVTLDEASVACWSKYGNPLTVYNAMKPLDKLHCESDIMDQLQDVSTTEEMQSLSEEHAESAAIRKCVLAVVRPYYFTRRIVNSDRNFTSVQLLKALRPKGLYARGSVSMSIPHFPRHILLKQDECARGTSRQVVSQDRTMVAASWFDISAVTVISNADPSTQTSVPRQVCEEKKSFPAPTCVKEYKASMESIDRLDQIRHRFSLASGQSFKNWQMQLGFALVSAARTNAYLTRKLAMKFDGDGDSPRGFILQLSSELISGKWKEAPTESQIFNVNSGSYEEVPEEASPSSAVRGTGGHGGVSSAENSQTVCSAIASKQFFSGSSRKRRMCAVCRWEDRYATQVTDYCVQHSVCLCRNVFVSSKPYACPQQTWTCWEKYHRFYLQHKLFSSKGNVRTGSQLYKIKQQHQRDSINAQDVADVETDGAAGNVVT